MNCFQDLPHLGYTLGKQTVQISFDQMRSEKMQRAALGMIVILALVFAGFAALIGAANKQGEEPRQIRVELQNGL